MHTMTIVLGLVIGTYAAPAFAQDAATAARAERGAYRHDGFYLRGSLGPAFHHTRIETDRSADVAEKASGAAAAGDVMIGGTPIPGLVIGGALIGDLAPSPKVTVGGQDAGGDFVESSTGLIAAFVDGYIDPGDGFHFGGAVGFVSHTLDDADDPTDQEETHEGIGGAVWCGYDFWVATQWSLGGMLRASGGVGKHDVERSGVGVTEKASVTAAALLFTALYH